MKQFFHIFLNTARHRARTCSICGQDGYIALMSTIIISLVLLGLTFTVSSAGYFTRFDSLDSEYKRVSLGLAESCQNMALLRLGQNFQYAGNETITVGTDAQGRAQTCTIGTITPAPTRTGNSVNATIPAQANYLGAFTNISTTVVVQNPNVAHVTPTTLTLTVLVPVGTDVSQFPITLDGSSVTSGQTSTVAPGVSHSAVVTSAPAGYSTTGWAGACTSGGSITPATGSANSCYISYTATPSTAKLTLVANIPAGANAANFHVLIDGAEVVSGQAVTVSPSTHTATFTMPASGYQASQWSGACSPATGVTPALTAGQNYTCVVNFTVPSTACADTVVMLDRTGSMSSTDRNNEGMAAKSLLDLYAGVVPTRPKVGVGSIGGLYSSTAAQVPTGVSPQIENGLLTSSYGNGSGSSQTLGANFPTATGTPSQWGSPNSAFTNDATFATDGTNGHQQVYNKFGLSTGSVPAGATITGVEVVVDGKATAAAQNSNATLLPNGVGSYNTNQWATQSGSTSSTSKTNAVSDSNDNTYVTSTTSGSAQTFKVDTSSIPAGATITSVVINVRARAGSGTPTMSLRIEKNASAGNQKDYVVGSVISTTVSAYSSGPLVVDPFANAPWTITELSSWGFGVVKTNSSGSLRLSELSVSVAYTYTPAPATKVAAELSWNNGTSWTNSGLLANLGATEAAVTLGGTTNTWGRTWAVGDFADGKLSLRLTNTVAAGMTSLVNYVSVKVYYTVPSTGLYRAIDTMMATTSSVGSDLSAEVSVGNAELGSARHTAGLQKVLILISDGVPNKPSGNTTSDKNSATTAANTAKSSGTQIFTIHFGDSSGTAFMASLSSGAGYSFDAPTSSAMQGIFNSIGAKVCPAAAAATQATLVVSVQVSNSYGGVNLAPDFMVSVSGAGANPASFAGSESGTSVSLTPGASFTLSETGPVGYYAPQYIGCPASVAAGQTSYCTIVSFDQPPPPPAPPPPPPPEGIDIGSWVENPTAH